MSSLPAGPRALLILASVCVVVAFFWLGLAYLSGGRFQLGKLPGDIAIEREGFSFYLPITTCLLLSGLFSLCAYLFRLFSR